MFIRDLIGIGEIKIFKVQLNCDHSLHILGLDIGWSLAKVGGHNRTEGGDINGEIAIKGPPALVDEVILYLFKKTRL